MQKFDQWRFVTVLTTVRSFDFIFKNIEDSLDFITGVNEALSRNQTLEFNKKVESINSGAFDLQMGDFDAS